MIKSFFIFNLVLISGLVASAGRYIIPPEADSLVQFNKEVRPNTLSNTFSALVWNVHKGKDEEAWVQDMNKMKSLADLFLLQEALDDQQMTDLFTKDMNFFEWFFVKSFTYSKNGISSGVATGSIVKTIEETFHRTKDREPVVGTPKTVMVSFYKLESGSILAVLNIHGLNKTANEDFYRQIDESLEKIKLHNGPVIYAGDFNTNNKKKFKSLEDKMAQFNLHRITYEADERKHQLDWIYFRGCQVNESQILYNYESSDHTPLFAKFTCQ